MVWGAEVCHFSRAHAISTGATIDDSPVGSLTLAMK